MIICVCRNLNQLSVRTAIDGGAETPGCVHAKCGTRPNCGKCFSEIDMMISEARMPRAAE